MPAGTESATAAEHEAAVLAIFDGETDGSREELEVVEADFGSLEAVEAVGTVVVDGELRTFVELTAGGEVTTGWYALDENGSIAAVDLSGGLPVLALAPAGVDRYRPAEPTGAAPRVVVTLAGDELTVEGPAGAVVARRG